MARAFETSKTTNSDKPTPPPSPFLPLPPPPFQIDSPTGDQLYSAI